MGGDVYLRLPFERCAMYLDGASHFELCDVTILGLVKLAESAYRHGEAGGDLRRQTHLRSWQTAQ